ncbi:hypothetical protein E2C01_058177 [Portunus trituberculatus]|uniref:Uncharacterized protein n=1 Tax=Portunus trituberculatus TaxID=210409 RepID=A0A5B7H409_PORTR|nr:hypothetical protein [Portunus trituberculatus]
MIDNVFVLRLQCGSKTASVLEESRWRPRFTHHPHPHHYIHPVPALYTAHLHPSPLPRTT